VTAIENKQKIYRAHWQTFYVRFQEYFRDFKYGNGKPEFAHLIDNKYSIAPMEDIMEILNITKRGSLINTLERFRIYNVRRLDNQISDKRSV
jgi:hypothetical protein